MTVAHRSRAVTIAVLVAASVTLAWFLATASAQPRSTTTTGATTTTGNATIGPHFTAQVTAFLERNRHRPIAGRFFTGVALVQNVAGGAPALYGVRCGSATVGENGTKPLRVRRSSFRRNIVACGWRIPKSAAGKLLMVEGVRASGNYFNGLAWRVRR